MVDPAQLQPIITSLEGTLADLQALVPPTPAPPPVQTIPASYSIGFAPIAENGGFNTSWSVASDGTMVVSNDVFNGYIRKPGDTEWKWLLRQDNLVEAEWNPFHVHAKILTAKDPGGKNYGIFCPTFAPSDPNRIYLAWNSILYRSDDQAKSFTRTALTLKAFLSDTGVSRRFTGSIAVHPTDPDKVIAGTNGDGCYYTDDGFTTFTQLNLPDTVKDFVGTPGRYLAAWHGDMAYIHVFGSGLYSFTPGSDPVSIGGPALASCLQVCPTTGNVYVCEFRSGNVTVTDAIHIWDGSAWSQMAGTTMADQVAIDPNDPTHIVWCNENGGFYRTQGGSSIWSAARPYRGQGESQWLSNGWTRVFPASIGFAPNGKFYCAEGVGINTLDLAAKPVLHDINAGIYLLISTCGLSVEGQSPIILGVMDKAIQRVQDGKYLDWSYPGIEKNPSGVCMALSLDYALDDPATVAGIFYQDGSNAISSDFGKSWTPMPNPGTWPRWSPGGDIAMSTKDNYVIQQGNNKSMWYVKNGVSALVKMDGTDVVNEEIAAFYELRDCVTADKTRPGTFAMLRNNTYRTATGKEAYGDPNAGIWFNSNGGEGLWEHTYTGVVGPDPHYYTAQFWQARLAYIPGKTGELLYSPFTNNNQPNFPLMHIKNDGRDPLIALPPYTLKGFDFGPVAPGEDYPSLWFWGIVGGKEGLYVTYDWFKTDPVFVTRWPMGTIGEVMGAIVADKNELGHAFLGLRGNGWAEIKRA